MVDFHGLEQVGQVFEIFVGQAKRCLRGNCRLEDQTGFVKFVEQAPNVPWRQPFNHEWLDVVPFGGRAQRDPAPLGDIDHVERAEDLQRFSCDRA